MKKPNKTPFNYGVVITGLIALVILIYVQANKEVKVDETGPESHFLNGKHKVPITEDDEHFIGPKETPEAKKKREAKKKDIVSPDDPEFIGPREDPESRKARLEALDSKKAFTAIIYKIDGTTEEKQYDDMNEALSWAYGQINLGEANDYKVTPNE